MIEQLQSIFNTLEKKSKKLENQLEEKQQTGGDTFMYEVQGKERESIEKELTKVYKKMSVIDEAMYELQKIDG